MADSGNLLFPIFLKLENLHVLIIGAGKIGLEKITAVLNSNPDAEVTLVAEKILPEVIEFTKSFSNVKIFEKKFEHSDLAGKDLIISAVNDKALSAEIVALAKEKKILINVADTPELCDFYLSSIVKKGNLKIAISTNGKSPTLAKRLKEIFSELLPAEIDEVLNNMEQIRKKLKGDFAEKVRKLNEITRTFKS